MIRAARTFGSSPSLRGKSCSSGEELSSMMWWHDGGIGWGGWVAMSVMMVTFWALLVFAGIALWKLISGSDHTRDARDPQRLLDERFARGNIDVDEYNTRRDLLRSSR
jgi:putative membrane protein